MNSQTGELAEVNIVVIENSPHEVMLIREALELWTRPYRVTFYQTGPEGLSALRATSEPGPTLILLDWNLGGMHGSKILEEIRQDPARGNCCVVILTASSSELDRQLAHRLGANRFLTKAIDLDDFFYSLLELQSLV